jgi:shikimate dehydrogenase
MDPPAKAIKTYCIIGDPISHSLSPAIHNAAFSTLKLNCTYISFKVSKGELEGSIASLRAAGIAGFNVTIPHKVDVLRYLDRLEKSAMLAGAVNTVNNEEGQLVGYNTDIAGFIEPIHNRKVSLSAAQVLLLGTGGAARAILAALAGEHIGKVLIATRDTTGIKTITEKAHELQVPCEIVPLETVSKMPLDCDLIVNATPLGMKGEPSFIKSDQIRKGTIVYDIVYRPVYTDLINQAKKAQAIVIFGYEMLLEQAAKSFEIWTGLEAPREAMKKSLLGFFGEPV